jgi:hypothetical protein
MGFLIALLIVNLVLSCVVGWVSEQRGRSFWLGFWLSAFLSPIFGVLILIALPGGSTVGSASGSNNETNAEVSASSIASAEPPNIQKTIDNAQYRLWLTKTYSISKNDVLGEYVCGDKAFPTGEDAIKYAHGLEQEKAELALRVEEQEKADRALRSAEVSAEIGEESAALGVRFDGEFYVYENYKYTSLADALAYARLQAKRKMS